MQSNCMKLGNKRHPFSQSLWTWKLLTTPSRLVCLLVVDGWDVRDICGRYILVSKIFWRYSFNEATSVYLLWIYKDICVCFLASFVRCFMQLMRNPPSTVWEIGIVSEKTVVAQSTRAGPEMIIYIYIYLHQGGGFKYFLCSSLLGKIVQFD